MAISKLDLRRVFNFATQSIRRHPKFVKDVVGFELKKRMFSFREPLGMLDERGHAVQLIGLRITENCNLRCHSCGQWGTNGYMKDLKPLEIRARSTGVEHYLRFIDEVADAGWDPIWYIWGGEPMMYSGIQDVLSRLKERNMTIALVTNGTNWKRNLDSIIEHVDVLYVSIDGPTKEIHDAQRPAAGNSKLSSWDSCLGLLEALNQRKSESGAMTPVVIPLTVVSNFNQERLVDIFRAVAPFSEMHTFYLGWWIDAENAARHDMEFKERFGFAPVTQWGWTGDDSWKAESLEAAETIAEQFSLLEDASNEPDMPLMNLFPELRSPADIHEYLTNHKAQFGFNKCISIYHTMEVNSTGEVSLCRDYFDYTIGNIKTHSPSEMFHGEKATKFRESMTSKGLMPVCRRCCGLMGM